MGAVPIPVSANTQTSRTGLVSRIIAMAVGNVQSKAPGRLTGRLVAIPLTHHSISCRVVPVWRLPGDRIALW